MESERSEFSNLCTRFLFLNHYDDHSSASVIEINLVLNELNAICFRHQQIADQKCALALMGAFPKIPPHEDTLIVKACYLLVSLVKKQKIRVPPNIASLNIVWLLKCLEKKFHAVVCDALKAFNVLFLDNVNAIEIPYERFLSVDRGLFTKLLKNPKLGNSPELEHEKNTEEDILQSALSCVETILDSYTEAEAVVKIPEDYITKLGDIVLRNIYRWELGSLGETHYATFIYRSLNILKILAELHSAWIQDNLGEVLGAARTFMVTGYVEEEWLKPQKVTPSQQILLEPQNPSVNKGGKIIRQKKTRKTAQKSHRKNKKSKNEDTSQFLKPYSYESVSVDCNLGDSSEEHLTQPTSESELSDSAGSKFSQDIRDKKKYRVRLTAIQLIGTLPKVVEQRTMFGYWHCLFSTNDINYPGGMFLTKCILSDPNHRCRISALQTISCLLHDAKKYLYQAESTERESTSFTPFSVALGNMILEIYRALFQALDTESLSPIVVQLLKCFIVLVPATPFHRLKPGLVTEIVKHLRKLVNHMEATIKLQALRLMGFIISITDFTPEIVECIGVERLSVRRVTEDIHKVFLGDVADEEEEVDWEEEEEIGEDDREEKRGEEEVNDEGGEKKMSWILETVLNCLSICTEDGKKGGRKIPGRCGVQSLEIQSECFSLLAAMSTHIGILMGHLKLVGEAVRNGLRDSAAVIVLNAAKALDFIAHSITQYFLNVSSKPAGELDVGIEFWLLVLPAVTEQLQGSVMNVKVICCDALSNIGGHIYENVPRDKQFLMLSLLHGNSSDNETIVRASACRALSVFAQFPSLRNDLVFVENTAEMVTDLVPIGDEMSRMKAAWALGNITDIQQKSDSPLDRLRDDLLEKMLRIAIASCDDQHKVRCNIVRAIGNLLYLIREDLLMHRKWQELTRSVIECLVENVRDVKFMKVRWNACYALGNMMKNPCFYVESVQKQLNWPAMVFPVLCGLIVKNPNFKVRINATVALGTVSSRERYGQHFVSIWAALIQALEQADNLVDFNEYKHRDNLMDQLCLTLAHCIMCAQGGDLLEMQEQLMPHLEMTRENWSRVTNRIVPERATPLLMATQKLKDLMGQKLPPDQLMASNFLASCFISPTEYL
ncbi:HEAT repeat-containing protein 6-like [Phlebotomus papatasi]|uniref:HEAT repeat-containing protein 6-like n=1 Tax=Phlebotomus papatasi TaxID=29031 RepID=UPI002483B443|nr:HEAT repeat-containing protein 6-like [Phlebotomus papatasi]